MEKCFGWKPEDLIGTNGWDKMHPDDIERIEKEFGELQNKDTPTTVEYRFLCKDGTYKWIELTAANRLNDPVINGVLVNYHDITERKESEEKLSLSESRLKEAQSIASIGNFHHNFELDTLWWSDETYKILGFTPAIMPPNYETFIERLPKKDRLKLNELVERAAKYGENYSATYRYNTPETKELKHIYVNAEVIYDEDNNPAGLRGTIQDVTDRKLSEIQLKKSEASLQKAQTVGHVGSWEYDIIENEITWSDEMYRIFGLKPQETRITVEKLTDLIHPDYHAYHSDLGRMWDTLGNSDFEYQAVRPDGEVRWIWGQGETVFDDSGNPIKRIGIAQDVTERKNNEIDLLDSKNKLSAIFDNTTDYQALFELEENKTLRVAAVNNSYIDQANSFGISVEEHDLIGITLEDLCDVMHLNEEETVDIVKNYLRVAETKEKLEFIEDLIINENDYYAEISLSPVLDSQGNCQYILYNSHDITMAKRADKLVKENEEKFRNLYANSPFGIIICEMLKDDEDSYYDFVHLEANHSTEMNTGFSVKDFTGTKASDLVDENTLKELIDKYSQVIKTGRPVNYEQYFEIYDRTLEVTAFPLYGELFIINFINITGRKKAEEQLNSLLEKEKFLGDIIRNASVAIAIGYPEGRIGISNDSFNELTGYTEEELRTINWNEVLTPEKWRDIEAEQLDRLMKTQQPVTYEKEYIRKDDSIIPIQLVVHGKFNEAGNIEYFYAFLTDISDKKKAEKEIEYQASLIQQVDSSIITINFDNEILSWNEHAELLYQWKKEEAIGKNIIELLAPEEFKDETYRNFEDLNREGHWEGDYEVKRKDGTRIPVHIINTYLKDHDGENIGFIGVSTDISERKQAESRIKESESNLIALIHNTNDFIWSVDRNYNFIIFNKTYSNMFLSEFGVELKKGMSAKEILIQEEYEYWTSLYEIVLTGEIKVFEFSREFAGEMLFFQTSLNPIYEDEEITGVSGRTIDITNIKKAEEKFRLMAENSIDCIWTMDKKLRFTYLSPSLEQLLGFKPEEWIGTSLRSHFTSKEFLKAGGEALKAIRNYKTFKPLIFESRILNKENKEVDVEITGNVLLDSKGDLVGLQGLTKVITERKKAEAALRESENKFRILYDYSPDMYVSVSPEDGNILLCNETLLQNTGYSKDELIGKHVSMVYHEDCTAEAKDSFRQYASEGRIRNKQLILKRKDGTKIDVALNVDSVRDETGKIMYSISSWRDNTELRQSELELRDSEKLLRKMAENYPNSYVSIIEKDYTIGFSSGQEFANQNIDPEQFTGLSIEEVFGSKASIVRAYYEKTFNGEAQSFELFINDQYQHYNTVPLYSETGTVQRILSVVENITNRRKVEEELKKYREDLESMVEKRTEALQAANNELEAFAYSVSHDLRAPLRAIGGYSNIILEDYSAKLDGEGQKIFDNILISIKRMGELIDDLLLLSRIGRQRMSITDFDMEELFNSTFAELTKSYGNLLIDFKVKKLPRANGDRSLIHRLVENLMSNAIKFSSTSNRPKIEVGCEIKNDTTIYYVKDNGVGFDEQYKSKLFEVFQRLHSEREFEGTGIGLAIVNRIISRHDGEIWAESKPGKGAVFYFSLSKGD